MESIPDIRHPDKGDFNELVFGRTQKIQQQSGESSEVLHERLRQNVINSFRVIEMPTKIKTPSWYTFDLERIGITGGGCSMHFYMQTRDTVADFCRFTQRGVAIQYLYQT